MTEKFLADHPTYLRWAVMLLVAGETYGAMRIIRDGMVVHGLSGFSLVDAVRVVRAERRRLEHVAALAKLPQWVEQVWQDPRGWTGPMQ